MVSSQRRRLARIGVAATATLVAGTVVTALPAFADPPYERIVGGEFTGSTPDPFWNGTGTTGRVVDGEFCTEVPGGTVNPWDALVGQNGVPFEAGQSYTLTFDAHATRPQPVGAGAGEGVAPYREIARQTFAVTSVKQTFSFTFTSTLDFPEAGSGQVTFHLGGQAEPNTFCLDNVSLIGGVVPPGGTPEEAPPIKVNQVAYVPSAAKRASVTSDSTTPLAWTLRDAAGQPVATGQTTPRGNDPLAGESVHVIDFSDFETPGTGYTIAVGDDVSKPFDIGVEEIQSLREASLAYFYHNRSGIEIEAQYVGAEHARPAGHIGVAPNQGDTSVPCRPNTGCSYSLDVSGGWYDAGDHGKYVVNGGISAWQLLDLYERTAAFGDLDAYADGSLAIPEQGNGVSDLLDEARWEVEFLLSMQAPAGSVNAGWVHHKMHDDAWTGLPMMPHLDPRARYLAPVSTAATLNMAAVAAQAARVWADIDPEFAARALSAARTAYSTAKNNPVKIADPNDGTGGGSYSDGTVTDEFYWAAAELYATTGEAGYRSDVMASPHYKGAGITTRGFDWGSTAALGDITLTVVDNGLPAADLAAIEGVITDTADAHLAQMATMGYPAPYREGNGEYVWGSNGLIANNGVVIALAHDLTGDDRYRDGVYETLGYLLGRNPVDYSYVTGYGERPVRNVHHRHWANQLDPSTPIAPPGALSGGPNSGLQDPIAARLLPGCAPQKCFVDHIEAYSLNEVTVNWNSAFAWLAGWTAEKAVVDPPAEDTPPTAPGTPVASAVTSTGLTLTWPASTDDKGVAGYEVLRVQGDAIAVVATVSGTTAQLSGLTPNTEYTYAVRAKDTAGQSSPLSPRVTVRTAPVSTAGCKVVYSAHTWNNGFTASVTITNTGSSAWTDWSLGFAFPGDQRVTQGWSATWSQSGKNVTAKNMPWNGALAKGQSVSIGFNGSHSGGNPAPTAFTVNGATCG
ncbi:glycoside hydrolase family 9 protein [Actinokineospora sp. UTMC 2448]|uniref:glycoside hydrolase family 9 protein n=1 Tax=Actinokineospora sp. UTMC 2448 TaxID=2268449 RepID=UPI002164602F|nr:glycoside hydrolase family 9 protein [Actinokineospora sp. UTMC 2448]UVS79052.1 Cellulase 1 precursor [Actinokineospora sp. UTMC 2448]